MATALRELVVAVSADTRKFQSEMQRAGQQSSQMFQKIREGGPQATRAWDQQTQAVRTHATALEASRQAIGRYAAVAAGAFGIGKLAGMADEWTQINARIRLAAGSTGEFEQAQGRLEEIASRTYRRYSEAAEQFAATARPMQELGFATRDTLDAAEALGLALVAGGSNAQKGATAIDAWGKSIAQGRIATEQFNSLLLGTPRVAQALADGLGKTTTELTEMARAGQLTAAVAVPALISQMSKLRKESDALPVSLQDAGIRLQDALQKWAGGANEASGATRSLVEGIELVTKHIDLLATAAISGGIGIVGSRMILAGKEAVQSGLGFLQAASAQRALTAARVADARETVVAIALQKQESILQKAFYADMVRTATSKQELTYATRRYEVATRAASRATAAHQASITQLTTAENASAAAKSRMAAAGRLALGAFGGPAGLAITVGMVAAGWLLFRDNADSASQSLVDFSGSADEAIAQLNKLNKAEQAGALLRLSDELEAAYKRIGDIVANMAQEADFTDLYGTFGPEMAKLEASFLSGELSADQFADAISGMADKLSETGQIEEVQRRGMIEYAAELGSTSRKAERLSGVLGNFNDVNSQTATQANATSGAIRGQAGAFAEMGEEAKKALDKMQQRADGVRGQLERLGKSAREVAHLDVRDEFRRLQNEGVVDFRNTNDPAVQKYIQAAADLINRSDELEKSQKRLAAGTKAAKEAAKESVSEQDKWMSSLNEQYADLILGQERQIALFGDTGRAAAMAYDLANGALSGLVDKQKEALQEQAEWLDFLEDVAAIEGVWDEVAKSQNKSVDKMTTYADQAARNMQTALGDSLYAVLDGKFNDIGDSFADMLKRMAAEIMASQIWSALGNAMAGYGGEGGWGNLVRGVGAVMTKGGKAGGGEVRPHSAYDVTEHGPELLQYGGRQVLMMGAQGGVVSPLMQMSGGGGGGAGLSGMRVEIVNNGSPARVESASMQKQSDGSQLLRMVLGAVADDVANGGRTAAAMKGRFGLREAV